MVEPERTTASYEHDEAQARPGSSAAGETQTTDSSRPRQPEHVDAPRNYGQYLLPMAVLGLTFPRFYSVHSKSSSPLVLPVECFQDAKEADNQAIAV